MNLLVYKFQQNDNFNADNKEFQWYNSNAKNIENSNEFDDEEGYWHYFHSKNSINFKEVYSEERQWMNKKFKNNKNSNASHNDINDITSDDKYDDKKMALEKLN